MNNLVKCCTVGSLVASTAATTAFCTTEKTDFGGLMGKVIRGSLFRPGSPCLGLVQMTRNMTVQG